MRKTSLEQHKDKIIGYFKNQGSCIFKGNQIREILEKNFQEWKLAQNVTFSKFLQFLLEKENFKKIQFDFPIRKETRYIYGDKTIYEIVNSLKPKSYFTHYTAMFFHELTQQFPKTIYLNVEQPKKIFNIGKLEQINIDRAFKNKVRVSNNKATYEDVTIVVLNGMRTEEFGVMDYKGPNGENLRVTNLERTLIDIAVRPVYSGGIYEVLNAYRLAASKVSINKLAAYLRTLNYTYPYHQVIGFYLQKAGVYSESQIDLLRTFETTHKFYLIHNMKEMEYSEEWKLFYPKGF